MEFETLHIENFATIGDVTVQLNQPGLILITGINKDAKKANSNGSGKSSIFEALCWCLWGQTIRDLDADDVVNRKAKKDCAVTLTLIDGTDRYQISRHRKDTRVKKPNDLDILKNGISLNIKSN